MDDSIKLKWVDSAHTSSKRKAIEQATYHILRKIHDEGPLSEETIESVLKEYGLAMKDMCALYDIRYRKYYVAYMEPYIIPTSYKAESEDKE